MKRRIAFLFSTMFSVVFSAIISTSIAASSALAADAIPGEFLVKYKDNAFASINSINAIANVRVKQQNPKARLLLVGVNPVNEVQTLARLFANPNVEYVTPNLRVYMLTHDSQETLGLQEQWAIKKVNAEAAWAKAGNKGSRKVTVAVIDTGADYRHPSLASNMVQGYDFRDNTNNPDDKTSQQNPGHGTHCSGIIGANGVVDGGTIGLSPEVSIMPLRFIGEDGSGDLNSAIRAIDYAIEKKANIISASWGATISRSQAQPLVDAVKRADDAGVVFVVAAANDGKSNDNTEVFPANSGFPNTISVAASDVSDAKPSWSNYGARTVHVASPGHNILSTLPGGKYGNLSGTSMATPLVSGMVAFLMAQDSTLTGAQARALLQHTGAKVQIETACHCRVDALSAVDMLLAKKMFIVPAAATVKTGATKKFSTKFASGAVQYAVANPAVGTISADGTFTAVAAGNTTITATDASGATSTTLQVSVGELGEEDSPAGGGGGGGGGGGSCPIGDQPTCDALCQVLPSLPWCH